MSTGKNVQEAIAQAKLNARVFRDLQNSQKSMLPTLQIEEQDALLKELGCTPEQFVEAVYASLVEATTSGLKMLKMRLDQAAKEYPTMLEKHRKGRNKQQA